MKIRLEEIAKKAEVSVAAVSMALNDKKGVGEETKQRILAVAEEMGYMDQRSEAASNDKIDHKYLKFVALKKHGFVLSDTAFFAQLMEGIEKESKKKGYELLVSNINYKNENRNSIIDSIKADNVEGILVLGTELDNDDISILKELDKPFVIIDSYFEHEEVDCILMDNIKATHQAVQYLVESGHKVIGYLHSSVWIHNFAEREQGLKQVMEKINIPMEKTNTILLRPTLDGAYQDMREYLKQVKMEQLPTSFFADNDIIAFGAVRALQEKGVRIPEDISIVGMDDMPFCEFGNPRLTTVRVFKQAIGRASVRRIVEKIEQIDSEDCSQKIALGTELIVRESVSIKER